MTTHLLYLQKLIINFDESEILTFRQLCPGLNPTNKKSQIQFLFWINLKILNPQIFFGAASWSDF